MQLSKYFTLAEFTVSQTASRNGINNNPPEEVLERLIHTAECMEKVRKLLGYPINISSGYRSPELNAAVKGAKTSQHLTGEACDFTCPRFGTPRQIVDKIQKSSIEYSQLILEYDNWVHISFRKGDSRRDTLIIDREGTRKFN